MEPKIIKTEKDYNDALSRIDVLMDIETSDQKVINEIELLATLVELYENEKWPIDQPNPIEAIRFRMEQQGLSQNDLIKFIGSKSKVSEVLSGKRSLSKEMIRKLHIGLSIPLESLISEHYSGYSEEPAVEIDCEKFPLNEMAKRGWISLEKGKNAIKEYHSIIKSFLSGLDEDILQPVRLRSSAAYKRKPDEYAIAAWRIRVLTLAKKEKLETKYEPGAITPSFRTELARLSYLSEGPALAKEFLNKNGIHLVTEEHLPHTYIDGAAMILSDGSPVVALSLRYDRLDNFWFVLFHELAHIALHLEYNIDRFFVEDLDNQSHDSEEKEADQWASESLIPEEIWKASGLNHKSTELDIIKFSKSLRINSSIPAGRIRRENKNYTIFSKLIGNKKVRFLFDK